ncbi:cysteine desulfurase [Faunimonas pinastri]|uniref:Cysteine desulfurase n=1 Tax=Faunimonas pinastri TaxID=1855383 RepID=A0A1H9CYU2_9HYPH|nr:cysteine desulfurase family protein [Faunimonas pinastri]SEQ05723.1 cysteine desulfurase [Faunimonas pinastri]
MPQRIYMDANAGAPLLREVRDSLVETLSLASNPSSVHSEGRRARGLVERARGQVAALVGARTEGVTFTSGATEAAVLALSPTLSRGSETVRLGRLYVGATEHPCVLAGGRFAPEDVERLPARADGRIDLDTLEARLAAHDYATGAPLVALMLANNETGIVNPVSEAARIVKSHGGFVFCDAVQAAGRIPFSIDELGVDFLSLSAHKLGGPQGVGALVSASEDLRPASLLRGGGQERYKRAGTENVTGIVGFGIAAELFGIYLNSVGELARLRDELEAGLIEISPEIGIMGRDLARLPNTTLFVVPGVAAETAVIAFDLQGIAVSAGSACSSGKVAASHVLEAMGLPFDLARSGIRVSLCVDASRADIHRFIAAWREIYPRLRQGRAA